MKWKKKFKFFPTILLSNTFLKKLLNWQHRAISFSAGVNSVCGFGVWDFWFKVWFWWNEPGFEWVQMFTCQVWSNWKLVIFGFDLTLKFSLPNLMKGQRFFFSKQYKYRCIFFDILTIFCSNASGIGIIRWSLTIMKFFGHPHFCHF